ncbi:hypothetical protein [Sphingomonas hengshuiensis]|uniref:Uncharacterized protein n=1 Tax=Sphingomonas hengshuiensis TaxID=1609977 RepID=A0A7U4LGE3_9SPHN|nr:hypothetical protein [Sphingomonas hengshuiensis]AJP73430.1 hypothetical protein TS85_19025 [Sphingomonas hengshuiensis]
MDLQKDEVLNRLATGANVAQFVAFRPATDGLIQSFCRLRNRTPNFRFESVAAAVAALLDASGSGTVNVRSYVPHDPRSREFLYALDSVETVVAALERLAGEGLHLIVNETIDVRDGGVSGVVQGGLIEFSPDDTPRCVEKPGVASLPFEMGMALLTTVYGFTPDLEACPGRRTEFSIHPLLQGWRASHTLLWEQEDDVPDEAEPGYRWPNRFSRHLGDKAYGLMMAHLAGLPVPNTLAIPRRVAPFAFGTATGSAEVWIRTCPTEPHPGLYTTVKGWTDPYDLMAKEDPAGTILASILRQDAVPARYSGAAIVQADGSLAVEGLAGEGDLFMLGTRDPEALPAEIISAVTHAFDRLQAAFGPVRFEWVHDGQQVWIVQLHLGATISTATAVVPGEAQVWTDFKVEDGLEKLRRLLEGLPGDGGVNLIGQFGLTSHIADVLRRAGLPARIAAG